MKYVIVTCIFDVQKRTNLEYKRTGLKYATLFNYVNDLGLTTILFTEEHLLDKIKKRDGLIIVTKNLEDLPAYKELKENFNDLKPPINATNVNPHMTAVINSKVYLMQEAMKYTNDITHLVWLDAGIAHVGTVPKEQFIEEIKLNIYPDKITLVMMRATNKNEILNRREYLSVNRGKIAAGLSIVPIAMIDWYYNELNKLFLEAINSYKIMCLEEQFISILTVLHEDKFEYIFSDYWLLYNLKYINNRILTVISNLSYCRDSHMVDLGYKILLKLLESLAHSKNACHFNDVCDILYNGQIIAYYKDKMLSKKLGLFLGYMYYSSNEGKRWIDGRFNNVRDNLKCSDIDISDKTLFTDEKIITIDTENVLWCIL